MYAVRRLCLRFVVTVRDQTVSQIIRRHIDGDFVPDNHTDLESLHFAAKFGKNHGPIFQLDLVISPSGHIRNLTFQTDQIIPGQ